MIGKSWSMAQLSGSDWNTEKLQKYRSTSAASMWAAISGNGGPVVADGAAASAFSVHQVELLGVGLVPEREDAAGEVLLGPLLGEDGVVEHLLDPVGAERLEVLRHLHQQRVGVLPQRRRHRLDLRLDVDHVDQQQRVVRGDAPGPTPR